MAGVIYLNPIHLNKPENHGTIIFNKNKDSFTMPYVYNTLIMYRSDFNHAPLAGFGNSLDTARLSMIFTIDKFFNTSDEITLQSFFIFEVFGFYFCLAFRANFPWAFRHFIATNVYVF